MSRADFCFCPIKRTESPKQAAKLGGHRTRSFRGNSRGMSSHRRRRCEVPGGHLCPVLPHSLGVSEKLRHPGGDQRRRSRRKKGEPKGGAARTENRGSRAARRLTEPTKGAEAMTPNGSPRAPGAAHRPQSRGPTQGEGEGQGPKAQGEEATRPDNRAEARTTRSAPREQPRRGAAPGGPQCAKRTGAR